MIRSQAVFYGVFMCDYDLNQQRRTLLFLPFTLSALYFKGIFGNFRNLVDFRIEKYNIVRFNRNVYIFDQFGTQET